MTRLPLVVLITALALGASACSADDEPSAGPVSEPTTTTPATAEPTTAEPPSTQPTTAPPTPTPTPTPTSTPPPPAPSPPPAPLPSPGEPDALPTTYDEAQARLDAAGGQEAQETRRFRTSTDVYCLLSSDYAIGCELPRGGIPDPAYCGEGPSQNIGRITFGDDGPTPECNSDTIREPGARRQPLGALATSSVSGVTCLVEQAGVTCVYPARGQAFYLGADEYRVFTAG